MKGGPDWMPNKVTTLEALVWWRIEYGVCKYIGGELHKRCNSCKVFKPMSEEFYRPNAKRLDGLDYGCIQCKGLPATSLRRRHGVSGRFEVRI